jgi:uncharacterized damage-inducible protein DinB
VSEYRFATCDDGRVIWTAPPVERPEGSPSAPETELLPGVLDFHRAVIPGKCAGLTGVQLARRPIASTNLSLLGLVRHMAKVERVWFRIRLLGEDVPMLYSTPEWKDADFEDLDPARAEHEYAALLGEQEAARKALDGVPFDRLVPTRDADISVRMMLLHMIVEYSRHNGHADLLREAVDGATGY